MISELDELRQNYSTLESWSQNASFGSYYKLEFCDLGNLVGPTLTLYTFHLHNFKAVSHHQILPECKQGQTNTDRPAFGGRHLQQGLPDSL